MNIKLEKPTINDLDELKEYVSELKDIIDAEGTNGFYAAIKNNTYDKWVNRVNDKYNNCYLIKNQENKIVGTINIRYKLNFDLMLAGGNIGYNTRPSERRKGYAKMALEEILKKAYEYGLNEVYIDCISGNLASENTIKSSGATLSWERYIENRNATVKRFILDLNKKYKKAK